ncbi:MAG TPA: TIGR04002 family protein, partial [Clostridia bacterium]|nr:TIGR04002 family protein [Clostridia bacterium]
MHKNNIEKLTFTAVFIALIFVTTAYILHIPVGNGYIHLGDSLIYLAASFLPAPFAIAAAALGAGMSDALTGFPQYVLFTMLIKPLNALCFSQKGDKLLTTRNRIAPFISAPITVVGYYLADVIHYIQTDCRF